MLNVRLRGRADAMAALGTLIAAFSDGRGAAVVIEGSAGLGKSRLLAEAARAATAADARVAAGRADEIEGIAPLSPLLGALSGGDDPVLGTRELVALERPGDQRFWLLEELVELLELRSRQTPLLITLDDVQWADLVTMWAVRLLSQRLASSPIGWVIATRDHTERPAVDAFVGALSANGANIVRLQPLSADDTAALAEDLLGGAPDAELNAFLDGVGGNPFLGLDLLQALAADGAIVIEDGVASLVKRRVPDRFQATVRGRVATLSRPALHLLQAGSVFGRSFRIGDVAAMLATWPSALVPLVDEAIRANFLVDVDAHLEFCHDVIRQAISADMTDSARVALHRGAAAAILAREGSVTEAATHLLASAEPGDDQAIAVLQEAAADIAGQAPRAAAELALRAHELIAPGRPGWSESLVATVRMLAWASRFGEAISLAERALTLDLDVKAEAEVRLGLADALMLGGRRREVIAQCREALATIDVTTEVESTLLHNLAFALAMDGEVTAAAEAYEHAIDVAAPDDPVVLGCRIGLAFVTGSRGDLGEGLTMAQACARSADAGTPAHRQRFPHAWLATALTTKDRFDDADAVFVRYRNEAEQFGASWALEFCQRSVCITRMRAGRLDDAEIEAEANIALIDALDMWHDSDVPFGVLALVAIHRDDLQQAHAQLARAKPYEAMYARAVPPYLAWATAALHDAEGDRSEAVAAMQEVFDVPELRMQNVALEPPLASVLVRLAVRAGDRARAGSVCSTVDHLAAMNPDNDLVLGIAAQCRGLLNESTDDLLDAAERLRASPRAIARASALEDAGTALTDDTKRSIEFLTEAFDGYADAGATRDALRVRSRLRRLGVRRPAPNATKASAKRRGWDSLTSAELRVVRLVAQGLTNREVAERLYVSTYTVGTHLKHAFDKVGVSSRVQLTRLATERGIDG